MNAAPSPSKGPATAASFALTARGADLEATPRATQQALRVVELLVLHGALDVEHRDPVAHARLGLLTLGFLPLADVFLHGEDLLGAIVAFAGPEFRPRQQALAPLTNAGLLPAYPFGTDLTDQELALAASLRKIKELLDEPGHLLATAAKALLHHGNEEAAKPFLERLHLEHPETTKDYLIQQLLMLELEERGLLKVS